METYKYYREVFFLELLKVLNWAVVKGKLPSSMAEATIIVLHKEKDPLDTSSYRPISLLCSDVKILAKVLATRLKKSIQENEGSRAILSLDAVKAFDSLEWHYLCRVLEEFGSGPSFIGGTL